MEVHKQHTNWNNCRKLEPLNVDTLILHMSKPVYGIMGHLAKAEAIDVFVVRPHIYRVFRPNKTIWSELHGRFLTYYSKLAQRDLYIYLLPTTPSPNRKNFLNKALMGVSNNDPFVYTNDRNITFSAFLDLGDTSINKGFIMHIGHPGKYIRTGWTQEYEYDVEFELTSVKKDFLWRMKLLFDTIVRFITTAKFYGVTFIQLKFQRVLYQNIPGFQTRCFEFLEDDWSQTAPHALVFGIINVRFFIQLNFFFQAFVHSVNKVSFPEVQLVLNDWQTGWLVRMLDRNVKSGMGGINGCPFYMTKEVYFCKSANDSTVVRSYTLRHANNPKLHIEVKPELASMGNPVKRVEQKAVQVTIRVEESI